MCSWHISDVGRWLEGGKLDVRGGRALMEVVMNLLACLRHISGAGEWPEGD